MSHGEYIYRRQREGSIKIYLSRKLVKQTREASSKSYAEVLIAVYKIYILYKVVRKVFFCLGVRLMSLTLQTSTTILSSFTMILKIAEYIGY